MENERSIYKLVRSIRKKENSIYNALRSIYDDAGFVAEIRGLRSSLPLVANLRCGLWYAPRFDEVCYFKSTDGHNGNWSFNPGRLNFHIALLAAQSGGCMIVDSTRKGKRFPDSMSKTIPIWTCVLNRALACHMNFDSWDYELHLPSWISNTERSGIEARIDSWVQLLLATSVDLEKLAGILRKPLRPLWISQQSRIWVNEVPETESLKFTPIILVSASVPCTATGMTVSRDELSYTYTYIPGAADDEESWARGLTPPLFWSHTSEIIDGGPDLCNKVIADIVAGHRTMQSQGCDAPVTAATHASTVQWIGDTGLGVAAVDNAEKLLQSLPLDKRLAVVDCAGKLGANDNILSVKIDNSKVDRHSLQGYLPSIMDFVRTRLSTVDKLLVFCADGRDICICVIVAILLCFFSNIENSKELSKWNVKQKLTYVCTFVSNANPSRGHLKQVYNYLINKD